MTNTNLDENPLLEPWTGPFEAPPFDRIEPGHFRFAADGETVVRLEARLGYVHKGVQALMQGADPARAAASSMILERFRSTQLCRELAATSTSHPSSSSKPLPSSRSS